jgi:hypothetical protein
MKWSKLRGGLQADFTGKRYDWVLLQGGLSDSRAAWLVQWARKCLADKVVDVRNVRSVLGRMAFSATLLKFLLP